MLLIIVHRLIQNFVFPPLNGLIIIAIGIIVHKSRKLLSHLLIIIGILFLYLQSIPFTAYYLTKCIEVPPTTLIQMKNSQAIIVLGGGIKNTGFEYPTHAVVNTDTLIRLRYASYIAHLYPDKLIITSGGFTGNHYTEALVMRDSLINDFHVTNQILLENRSRNTDENAKFVAQILAAHNITQVVVVTQAYHMRRAIALFKKYGVDAIAAPTDFYNSYDAKTLSLAFIPNAGAMQQVARVLHEILGYFIYIIL